MVTDPAFSICSLTSDPILKLDVGRGERGGRGTETETERQDSGFNFELPT